MTNYPGDPSRAFKWVLLISSLVTIGFLLGAAGRENVTAQWRGVQNEYKNILLRKAVSGQATRAAGSFRVEIKQVAAPALNAVDRCVTCHNGIDDPRMAGELQPHRTHPGGLLAIHRVEKFGCTVCHQGQGAALTFEEAKAEDVFWDYPLLPASMTEASCNTCHDPRALSKQHAPKLVRGMELFESRGCSGCHKLNDKGGVLGPALDNVGIKTKHQFVRTHLSGSQTVWNWLSEHFRDPRGIVRTTLMPNPALSPADNEALTVYMLSLRRRPIPEQYLAPDKIEEKYARLHPPEPEGQALYQRYCMACHDDGRYGRWDKTFQRFVPAIRGAAFLRTEDDECLAENIAQGRPGTLMPGWGPKAGGLADKEIHALVSWLRGSTASVSLPAAPPHGAPERGRALFLQNCAGCHGVEGKGGIAPALNNPVFQTAATDSFIAETIRAGREHTAMPSFGRAGFGQQEIGDLLAFVRNWAPRQTARTGD